ncbi:hypothetical protein EKO29_13640 [Colwellia sp. Arc7-635]|jgi:hypothetical protein|uniref:hypothetical protein n=1 Tax=Colwellia sp. Arc7-635 TaxID=2497879 RepID=UPI000F8565AC|nr:hypothetical protein [Colwellia sp. Arc7-635]AZQ84939.1 hypothetical protein EKO29_13640 [Colwellia sp. Arc7-635]
MGEHGTYSVLLEGELLNINLSGMFNDLATNSLCQLIEAQIESLNGQRFFILLNCIDYQGSTPEAHDISNQHALWLKQQNCVASAIVYKQNFYFNIAKSQQPALSKSKKRKEFFNMQAAKGWLVSLF